MRHRTAIKTGRAAVLHPIPLGRGSFRDYAAMVERCTSPGYFRRLPLRLRPRKSEP